MNAVFRLNLLVSFVFLLALSVTLFGMLQQASRDITREINSSISYTHQLLTVAAEDAATRNSILTGELRHVRLKLIEANQVATEILSESADITYNTETVPEWFYHLIPGIDLLEEKYYMRYLDDGRAIRLQADTSDEMAEVWESVQQILGIFILSALISNIAIYLGVRQGIKPVEHFLEALNAIRSGRYTARLQGYSIKEINELSVHFNKMAEEIERSEQENKSLMHQIMNVQEKERAYLARELHDDLGQYLTGIQAQAFLIEHSVDNPLLVEKIGQQITDNCHAMQAGFRQLVRELHPVVLEQLGLCEALRNLVSHWQEVHNVKVDFQIPDVLPTATNEWNTHIYRIAQEALNNVARHAGAKQVDMHLLIEDNKLIMCISDDGCGLPEQLCHGLGLRSMQERASYLNGKLIYESAKQGGLRVCLTAPLQEMNE